MSKKCITQHVYDEYYSARVDMLTINTTIAMRCVTRVLHCWQPDDLATELNVDTAYTDDYPIMFNIILWTMVVLGLSVAAVSYGIWFMDPGRDSIIYRMTSQRLKTE